jgi:hypothetical protein
MNDLELKCMEIERYLPMFRDSVSTMGPLAPALPL